MTTMRKRSIGWWVAWGAGAAVAGLLVVAAILAGRQDVTMFGPGTPEATAQTYLQAIKDRRWTAAFDTFTDKLAERCGSTPVTDLYYPDIARVALLESDINGDRATVQVAITEAIEGGLLNLNENTMNQTIVLTRSSAGWRISEAPWPLYYCDGKSPQ